MQVLGRSDVPAEHEAEMLRLHYAERWPVGTIATQLDAHPDQVRRVLGLDDKRATSPIRRGSSIRTTVHRRHARALSQAPRDADPKRNGEILGVATILVDILRPALRSPEIVTARVVGHGAAHDAAFDPIRDLGEQYPRFAVRYTGTCTEPLIRPSLVIDDETLEILAEPLKRPSLGWPWCH